MKYKIIYDKPGRLRLRCGGGIFEKSQQPDIEHRLLEICGVNSAQISSINGGILVCYGGDARSEILEAVNSMVPSELEKLPLSELQEIDSEFKAELKKIIGRRIATKLFLPSCVANPITVFKALRFIKQGLISLWNGKLGVDVLDAASISASIMSGNVSSAASVMTLLNISALLEDYTKKKATTALSDSLSLNIDKVWRVENGIEKSVPLADVAVGDVLRVRCGSMIPVDGSVASGAAEVCEASMTGEAAAAAKTVGMTVYAGTVIESGAIDISVSSLPGDSRIRGIIDLIQNSEELKSGVQSRAEVFADRIVPFSFAAGILAYAITGNPTKALSVLMVDFSCAIKLSTPISVISAMREAADYSIMVKGGRYLENFAAADTVVFDKTGTLTVSCPTLSKICAFDGFSEEEVLKTAACLEEHFPHSVAKAIVRAAEEAGLEHREEHAEVEYIVAHGIASHIGDKRTLIGSAHFVFDDENIAVSDEQREIISELGEKYSMVYLAVGGKLCGILCIEDPIRPGAEKVIEELKSFGISNMLMITGDGESTAKCVCRELGIDKFHARVLPEDKLNIVNSLKEKGHKVIMVGDGINDSPALAAADVSVAMKDSSDIAREAADITLLSSDLEGLVVLRRLSDALFGKIHSNFRFITTFNSGLLALGLAGILSPGTSALLHNLSTMGICLAAMKPLINDKKLITGR